MSSAPDCRELQAARFLPATDLTFPVVGSMTGPWNLRAPAPSTPALETWHVAAQWATLLLVSVLFAGALELADLPAALLIGPMLAAIVAGTNGATVRVPPPGFAGGAGGRRLPHRRRRSRRRSSRPSWTIGRCSPARSWRRLRLRASSAGSSAAEGRCRDRPRSGVRRRAAATAMVLMAEAFGADARLVAFMQYLRVIMVSVAAAIIARLWVDTSGVEEATVIWFPVVDWPALARRSAFAHRRRRFGQLLRLPSPYFLGAVILGTSLHLGFGVPLQLPQWLLAFLRADRLGDRAEFHQRRYLRHAVRALPQIVGSILALMAFCGGLAMAAQPRARHRPADRLSGDQPRRDGFRRHHRRRLRQRRPLLRHGAAKRPAALSCWPSGRRWHGWSRAGRGAVTLRTLATRTRPACMRRRHVHAPGHSPGFGKIALQPAFAAETFRALSSTLLLLGLIGDRRVR